MGYMHLIPDAAFWPLSAGGIPGWDQTAGRGEIMAMISALMFGVIIEKTLWLWVDNEEVLRRIRMDPEVLRRCHQLANHDLWREVARLKEELGENFKGGIKVDSHQRQAEGMSWVHKWAVRGNSTADTTPSHVADNTLAALAHISGATSLPADPEGTNARHVCENRGTGG